MDAHPTELQPHPVADLFPLMQGTEFDELVADVKEHGLREPIIIDQHNRIVDGRNRYRACVKLDIEIRHIKTDRRTLTDEEARDLIVSLNLHRRHLSTTQRAAIAADMANLKQGGTQPADLPDAVSQAEAAKVMRVGERTARMAAKVRREDPALYEEMKTDAITVHAADQKLKERSGNANAKKASVKKPATAEYSKTRDLNTVSGHYGVLFEGLTHLPDDLKKHPLPVVRAAELIDLLKKSIALLKAYAQPASSEKGEPINE